MILKKNFIINNLREGKYQCQRSYLLKILKQDFSSKFKRINSSIIFKEKLMKHTL